MNRDRYRPLFLAGLVVLAGCLGPGGTQQDREPGTANGSASPGNGPAVAVTSINWTEGVDASGAPRINTVGAAVRNEGTQNRTIAVSYRIDGGQWDEMLPGAQTLPVEGEKGYIAVAEHGVDPGNHTIDVAARSEDGFLANRTKRLTIQTPDLRLRDFNLTYRPNVVQSIGAMVENVGTTDGTASLYYKIGDSEWTSPTYAYSPLTIPAGESTSVIYDNFDTYEPGTYNVTVELRFNAEAVARRSETISLE